eukprot:NODE_3_length_80033_cov_0.932970.p30 type:complete len:277 gc:universal NODE_3_length_80033_cov_0.932970:72721-73551(+)
MTNKYVSIRPPREVGYLPMETFVIGISVKRNVQSVINALSNSEATRQKFRHLKVIRPLKLNEEFYGFVCDVEDYFAILLGQAVRLDKIKLTVNEFIIQFLLVKLPSLPPLSSIQYDRVKNLWPIHFKCNLDKSYKLSDSSYITQQTERIVKSGFTCAIINPTLSIEIATNHIAPFDSSQIFDHPVMTLLDLLAIDELRCNNDKRYLATDCDCFIKFEPCVMCGMALLHSRIKRIFILRGSSTLSDCGHDKAFSQFYLHCQSDLNHRFLVYNADCSP